MAEMTLEQIRKAVRFRGDYQNLQKFPNDSVNGEIQKSFGEFYEIVDDTSEGWWDTDGDVTTVAAQAYVALPTDCWRVKAVFIIVDGEPRPLTKVTAAKRSYFSSGNDQPTAYRPTARGLDLYPTPNAAYTIRVTYAPKAPSLVESQPREWYTGWDDYVIESTLLKLAKRERKPLGEHVEAVKMASDRVKAAASKRDSNGPELINLHEGPYGDSWDEVWR